MKSDDGHVSARGSPSSSPVGGAVNGGPADVVADDGQRKEAIVRQMVKTVARRRTGRHAIMAKWRKSSAGRGRVEARTPLYLVTGLDAPSARLRVSYCFFGADVLASGRFQVSDDPPCGIL